MKPPIHRPVPGFDPDRGRLNAYQRGYDRRWGRLRSWHLAREPLCRKCMLQGVVTAASEVDHIVPIERAPERRLDADNLQSLCHPHHVEKTNAEG